MHAAPGQEWTVVLNKTGAVEGSVRTLGAAAKAEPLATGIDTKAQDAHWAGVLKK